MGRRSFLRLRQAMISWDGRSSIVVERLNYLVVRDSHSNRRTLLVYDT